MVVGLAAMLGVLGVSAAAASASTFESSGGTGSTKGVGIIKQEEFKTWPMTINCTKATSKGSVPPGQFASFTDEVKFSSCTALGKIIVTVTPEVVEYNAEGTETIVSPFTLTPQGLKCHYEIEAQSLLLPGTLTFGDELFFGNTKFPNGQQKLALYTKVKSTLHYTATGWPCTGPKESTELKEAKETTEEGEEGSLAAGIRDENTGGNVTWVK
jgi:hypothetical protein